jgi:hypothetical protein
MCDTSIAHQSPHSAHALYHLSRDDPHAAEGAPDYKMRLLFSSIYFLVTVPSDTSSYRLCNCLQVDSPPSPPWLAIHPKWLVVHPPSVRPKKKLQKKKLRTSVRRSVNGKTLIRLRQTPRLTLASSRYDKVFTILVGSEEQRFFAHKDLICAKSKFFQATCSNR